MNYSDNEPPSSLQFLYHNYVGSLMRSCLTQPWISKIAGWFCDKTMSAWCIKSFIKQHNINMDEAKKPLEAYNTFNEFFIRELKTSARPFDYDKNIIVSPADGTLFVVEHITQAMQFPVKESHFNLSKFLGSIPLAQEYEGGTLLLFRLSPWDYHRFHFPVDCVPLHARTITGKFESVHPIVYQAGIQPLTENERHLTILKTELYDEIVMISVGALFVGAIRETYKPNAFCTKASEAGYFCFGGSTIVLLFKANTLIVDQHFLRNSMLLKETPVKMGMTIGRVSQKKKEPVL